MYMYVSTCNVTRCAECALGWIYLSTDLSILAYYHHGAETLRRKYVRKRSSGGWVGGMHALCLNRIIALSSSQLTLRAVTGGVHECVADM